MGAIDQLGSPIEVYSPGVGSFKEVGEESEDTLVYQLEATTSTTPSPSPLVISMVVDSAIQKAEESLETSKRQSPPTGHTTLEVAAGEDDAVVKDSPNSKDFDVEDEHQNQNHLYDESEENVKKGCGFVRSLREKKENNPDEDYPIVGFHRLYEHMDRYDIFAQILGIIGALGNGVIFPIFTIIFGDILDDIAINYYIRRDPNALSDAVSNTVPKFMYLGVGGMVAAFFQVYFLGFSSVRQANRLREKYFSKVLSNDIAYFDTVGTSGMLLQGLTDDCQKVQKAIGEKISMFLFFMSTAISGIVIAFTKGWDMTLVLLAFMPVLVITGYFASSALARINARTSKADSGASSLAQEALANVRTVFSFNGQERTITAYDEALAIPEKIGTRQGIYNGLTIGMTTFTAYCGYALSMWYGATKVGPNGYTGGDVINVLLSALIGGFALGQAVPNWQGFQIGRQAAARLYAIMERSPDICLSDEGETPDSVTGVIEFQDVKFAYPSRPDKIVFGNFTLRVEAGQTVALVGESGSGKSTWMHAIAGLIPIASGTIQIEGQGSLQSGKKAPKQWRRNGLSFMPQRAFFGTA